jgi:hypothetical protein
MNEGQVPGKAKAVQKGQGLGALQSDRSLPYEGQVLL